MVPGAMLAGCGKNDPAPSGSAKNLTLKASVVTSISSAVVTVGSQKGWFAQSGLTLTPQVFASGKGAEALQSLGGRNGVDVTFVGTTPIINSAAHGGIKLKVISVINDTSGAFVLFAQPGITDVAGLKGKQVAFARGSTYDFFLRKALIKAGLAIDDIKPVYLGASDAVTAFVGKHVDACVPETSQIDIVAQKDPSAKIIFRGSDFDATEAFRVVNVFLTTPATIESKRDALKALLAVYHGKVVPFCQDEKTRDDAVKLVAQGISEWGGGTVDPKAIGKTMATQSFYNISQVRELMGGPVLIDALRNQAQFLKDAGAIASVPDLADLVDSSLLPSA